MKRREADETQLPVCFAESVTATDDTSGVPNDNPPVGFHKTKRAHRHYDGELCLIRLPLRMRPLAAPYNCKSLPLEAASQTFACLPVLAVGVSVISILDD